MYDLHPLLQNARIHNTDGRLSHAKAGMTRPVASLRPVAVIRIVAVITLVGALATGLAA